MQPEENPQEEASRGGHDGAVIWPDRLEFFKDSQDQWRWRRRAPNGKIVATSGEGYHNRVDMEMMAYHVNGSMYEVKWINKP